MQGWVITTDFKSIPIDNLYAYIPFDWDLLDHKADLWASWTPLSLSRSWTISFTTWKVWQCWVFNWSILYWNWIRTWNVSIMFRAKRTWNWAEDYQWMVLDHWYLWLFARNNKENKIIVYNRWDITRKSIIQMQLNQRYHFAIVWNWSQCYVFINWVKYWPYPMWAWSDPGDSWIKIWQWTTQWAWQKFIWNIDEVLIYKRLLTDSEVIKYYNKTK